MRDRRTDAGIYWTRILAIALLFPAFQGRILVLSAGQTTAPADPEIGVVTTLAGSPGSGGYMDDTGSQALFESPKAMSTDSEGNVYTVDNFCGTIRRITPEGVVTTIAGPENGCAFGSTDGTGSEARFNSPSGTTVDSAGNVYVADSGNCTLRKITPAGVVTTVAGSPSVCVAVDGPRSVARFNGLAGVAVGPADDIYVTSWQDCTVRRVTQDGDVTTIAGLSAVCASLDGVGSAARFDNPSGISADSAGNFYVADETGCTIRKMTLRGVVTTMAGDPGVCDAADGVRGTARFNIPSWTAVDDAGNVYASDYLNFTVRQITPAGVVTTLAGLAGTAGSADGTGTEARFNHPDGIAVDSARNIYVADRDNNTIRKITVPAKH